MKKVVALVLALGMSALLFAACDDTPDQTTDNATSASTSASSATETSASTAETTTEPTRVPRDFADEDTYDSIDYGYYIKVMRDENNNEKGVAVLAWKDDYAEKDLVFQSKYVYRDYMGVTTEFNVTQVGVVQGVPINFHTMIESVTMEEGITVIGDSAFVSCTNLKTLTLPEGLTSIGKMAFWNCKSLETLVIPSTVTSIGSFAFSDCVALKSVTLPRAFEGQVDNIFHGCTEVTFTFVD